MQTLRWVRRVPIFLAICMVSAVAQSTQDLPSAPSAVQQETAAPKPMPAPARAAHASVTPPPAQQQTSDPAVKASESSTGPAKESKPETDDSGAITIPVSVNEVNVVFTVTDRHNRYVQDLAKSDFKVVDDDKPVDLIRSFRRETELPLQVGLLIDASNSIRDRFKFEQESAIEFLNDTIRRKYDQAFVIGFDDAPELTQDFTDNVEALTNGVLVLRPGNGTALYDAIYYASRDKLLKSAQGDSVRRALIVVTDGNDNRSHVTREEAIEMALRADAIVYTISTNFASGGESEKYDDILERIAEATGGRSFRPFQLSDVANAFIEIQEDLRSQYALSYHPPDFVKDGHYRTIEILANRKGLKVRSRSGYYAPTE